MDEKYEWDSEYAMESEIVEALRHFGNHSRSRSVSQVSVIYLTSLWFLFLDDEFEHRPGV